MMDEIEELWKLAEECREWARETTHAAADTKLRDDLQAEFDRLAEKIDWIARRLAARLPT